jgi:hypothetical protein
VVGNLMRKGQDLRDDVADAVAIVPSRSGIPDVLLYVRSSAECPRDGTFRGRGTQTVFTRVQNARHVFVESHHRSPIVLQLRRTHRR